MTARQRLRIVGLASLVVCAVVVLGAASPDSAPFFHESKEVAGLAIVFGAEPEPALTEEIQFLRWRISSLDDEQPFTELTDAQVRITRNGQAFGPHSLRAVRGTPGQYETRHIFTEPGTYESVLTFKKGEEATVHTVDFGFTINDRADLEVPGRR
jgi:hypothetical protein